MSSRRLDSFKLVSGGTVSLEMAVLMVIFRDGRTSVKGLHRNSGASAR